MHPERSRRDSSMRRRFRNQAPSPFLSSSTAPVKFETMAILLIHWGMMEWRLELSDCGIGYGGGVVERLDSRQLPMCKGSAITTTMVAGPGDDIFDVADSRKVSQ